MQASRLSRIAVATASAVLVAAVGTRAASAADYRHAADGACAKYDRTTSALPTITSAAEMKRQVILVPKLFGTMVTTIAALEPPAGKATEARRLLASLRMIGAQLGRIRDAFMQGNQSAIPAAVKAGEAASRTAVGAARSLGLPSCAKLAAAAAKETVG